MKWQRFLVSKAWKRYPFWAELPSRSSHSPPGGSVFTYLVISKCMYWKCKWIEVSGWSGTDEKVTCNYSRLGCLWQLPSVLGTSQSEVYEVIPHFTFGFVLGCGVVWSLKQKKTTLKLNHCVNTVGYFKIFYGTYEFGSYNLSHT